MAHDPQLENCRNCGGPLPAPVIVGPQSPEPYVKGPGPEPPPPPRTLPAKYRKRVLYYRNVLFIIGVVFTAVFFWTVILPVVGILLIMYGLKKARQEILALEQGRPARGRIQSVRKDTTTTLNNRHPWVIEFSFMTPSGERQGRDTGWDDENAWRRPGDEVWVVYMAQDPDCSAVWPPVA